jgi:hypothetical protein
MIRYTAILVAAGCFGILAAPAADVDTRRGDGMIAEYFRIETARLSEATLADVKDRADWEARRPEYRRQLLEMLGLDPLPERTDLQATVTGRTEHEEFIVERLHYQSRPGLYVTANLYLPRDLSEPAPAVLYVCGHGASRRDGISFGTKATYQHHGAWFARHGFVCLTLDTLQLGEIEGIHHGTYRYDMWWWLNRGYTPAGVEAWNCIRALDYLETRDEVDAQRIGVTGRSGGGAYSWWIAAVDDRIQAAVPVAGITDLENHVVDGVVEGHCDCMYMVNTYRWDYPLVAALVAPRPLLISNTDRDNIFPLEGVVRTHAKVRRIYQLYGAADKLGLQITAGPHRDTQELHIHAFRWLNQHLRGDDSLIEKAAVRFFEPPELKVFQTLPEDQINTEIHETFVPRAEPQLPEDQQQWSAMRDDWQRALLEKTFRGWPEAPPLNITRLFSAERDGVRLEAYEFDSDRAFRLRLYLAQSAGAAVPESIVLNVLDEPAWHEMLATYRPAFETELNGETLPEGDQAAFENAAAEFAASPRVIAYIAPRGVGPTAWDATPRKQTQIRRRFYLLGQSRDGMQVWDVRRAVQALRSADNGKLADVPLEVRSWRQMAGVALYASLFEPEVARLELHDLPPSHREGPYLLNVTRYLDTPQAVAMAAERAEVRLATSDPDAWSYPRAVAERLGWGQQRVQLEDPADDDN